MRELKPAMKIIDSKSSTETLESEVESQETQRESSFIGAPSAATPTLRQTPLETAQEPLETPLAPRVREVEQQGPTTYTPRTDAQLYTALSTENRSSSYTMHSGARADERLAMQPRARQAPAPSLGPQPVATSQDRMIGSGSALNNDQFRLRSAGTDTQDRRYDLYREDSLQDANKPRRARR